LAIDLVVTACQSPKQIIRFGGPGYEHGFIGKLILQFVRDAHNDPAVVCLIRTAGDQARFALDQPPSFASLREACAPLIPRVGAIS
jgi:hypothetical protein